MAKIALVSNSGMLLYHGRRAFIKNLLSENNQVSIIIPEEKQAKDVLTSMGAKVIFIKLNRKSMNVFSDFKYFISLYQIFRTEKYEVILNYTIKPIIYGSLAGFAARVKKNFSMLTGMGYIFTGNSWKKKCLQWIFLRVYKVVFILNSGVFVLNEDDKKYLLEKNILPQSKLYKVNGAGVDLDYFYECPVQTDKWIFTFIGRLLTDKGIVEFIDAARLIKAKYPQVEFWVVGELDANLACISKENLKVWTNEQVAVFHGQVDDVRTILKDTTIFVLPSYREGMPRVSMEAMSMGRPIITTDAPGCRETVKDGLNGYLVSIADSNSLAAAMEKCLQNNEKVIAMGKFSRKLAETHYNILDVNQKMLNYLKI